MFLNRAEENSFLKGRMPLLIKSDFRAGLDLYDSSFMDRQINRAETELPDLFLKNRDPIWPFY